MTGPIATISCTSDLAEWHEWRRDSLRTSILRAQRKREHYRNENYKFEVRKQELRIAQLNAQLLLHEGALEVLWGAPKE
jgi:hypothetical protein